MQHRVGIICNGITGRQGRTQHLRALLEIRDQGGVQVTDGEYVVPDLILIGRDEAKLADLCNTFNIASHSKDLFGALTNPAYQIYLDTQITEKRYDSLKRAIRMGKVVFAEMPLVCSSDEAIELARLAAEHSVKGGVVQNMLYIPGVIKMRMLRDSGFFGKIVNVQMEFGYWVFDGRLQKVRRPAWAFQKGNGGIIRGFFGHARYLLEHLVGEVLSVQCAATVNITERYDDFGRPFACTAEDTAYATMELEGGVLAQVSATWCSRLNRRDVFTIQIDGTTGSAVATLRDCFIQPAPMAPQPRWNPEREKTDDFMSQWQAIPDHETYTNTYRIQWEMFLRHVYSDLPYTSDLLAGARDVRLIESALSSAESGKRITLPPLNLDGAPKEK